MTRDETEKKLNPPMAITVFAPTPILTVTIESRNDQQPELHIHAGGQGFWVARMIARLGVRVALCAPFGGDSGRLLKALISDENVDVIGVTTAGANGSYVHDRRSGQRVEICQVGGSMLDRHEVDDLFNATFAAAMDSRLLVLTGQYPTRVARSNVYRRLAKDLRENGRRVIADLTDEELEEALQGGVDLLCFSHEELIREGYSAGDQRQQLISGIDALRKRGAQQVILHRGAEPTIAWVGGQLLEVISPRVTPLDHRGGGDTFFAALAVGLLCRENIEDTIRFAAAAGTLNVTRHGLGTGRIEDIHALSQHVEVRPLA